MPQCRQPGVPEVIGIFIALISEVEPGMRILMHEQRCTRIDKRLAFLFNSRTLPGVPGRGGNRMTVGADGQQIHREQLAITIPTVRQESALRRPALTKRRTAIPHPGPIDPLENFVSKEMD